MTDSARLAPARSRDWLVPLVRAIIAAVAALVITFTSAHDARLGLIVFGAAATVTGITWLVAAVFFTSAVFVKSAASARASFPARGRTFTIALGVVSVVAGGAALASAAMPSPQLELLLLLVTGWGAITGLLELVSGVRERPRATAARDRIVVGALTIVLAIVYLVVPTDVHQSFSTPEGVTGVVTSPVILVGVLGAYFAIIAVYLGIGAFSPKTPATHEPPATAHDSQPTERSNA